MKTGAIEWHGYARVMHVKESLFYITFALTCSHARTEKTAWSKTQQKGRNIISSFPRTNTPVALNTTAPVSLVQETCVESSAKGTGRCRCRSWPKTGTWRSAASSE